MVHKVNNARIIQKLEKRYNLTNVDNAPLMLLNTIQPITSVDILLSKLSYSETTNIDLTSTGYKLIATVPSNKRWRLKSVYAFVSTGTTARITRLAVLLSPSSTQVAFYTGTAATSQTFFLPQELILNPGDAIYFECTTGNAGDIGAGRILYDEEDYYG